MGSGRFSADDYAEASRSRAASGTPDFAYDSDVKTGKVANVVHKDLDPKWLAGDKSPFAGKPVRESRDSDEHPNSLPIAVFFDVTGSMGRIPKTLQQKLPKLMEVVLAKAGVKDPQILVGAIGDANCDQHPLQLGQFESSNKFDDHLRSIILEGGGGGQNMESYGLAYRAAAEHFVTDSFEKRGKKGYLITIGDEKPWPTVSKEEVSRIFGIQAEKDETVQELLDRVKEKWEVFHLHAQQGSYRDSPDVLGAWSKLLGERLIKVDDADLICEVIAGIVHMIESALEVDEVVKDIGVTGADASVVSTALAPLSRSLPVHVAEGGLPKGHGSSSSKTSRV